MIVLKVQTYDARYFKTGNGSCRMLHFVSLHYSYGNYLGIMGSNISIGGHIFGLQCDAYLVFRESFICYKKIHKNKNILE